MSVVQLRGGGYLRTEALRFTFPAVMDRLDQIAAERDVALCSTCGNAHYNACPHLWGGVAEVCS